MSPPLPPSITDAPDAVIDRELSDLLIAEGVLDVETAAAILVVAHRRGQWHDLDGVRVLVRAWWRPLYPGLFG